MPKTSTATLLHLTPSERAIFEALPAALRREWTVAVETRTFTDSQQQLRTRMRNLRLKHPLLKQLQKKAKTEQYTPEQILDLAESADLSGLAESDILALAFAWGPGVFTTMIGAALAGASTADAVRDVAHLSFMRHGLLEAVNR